eukprot:m.111650 g.111650  ORF g.111650 m.111650 type:complete len:77 (-) comp14065_c0_seq6:321-551(-)
MVKHVDILDTCSRAHSCSAIQMQECWKTSQYIQISRMETQESYRICRDYVASSFKSSSVQFLLCFSENIRRAASPS